MELSLFGRYLDNGDVIRHAAEERPIKHTLILDWLILINYRILQINATLTNILSELKGRKQEFIIVKRGC